MPSTSLTHSQRGKIEAMLELGISQNKIAKTVHKSKSTISYELRRCSPYNADIAQKDAENKQHYKERKTTLDEHSKYLIEDLLEKQ